MNPHLAKAEAFLISAQEALQISSHAIQHMHFPAAQSHAEMALGLFQEVHKMIERGEVTAKEIVDLIGLPHRNYVELVNSVPQMEQYINNLAEMHPDVAQFLRPLPEALRSFIELAR